MFQFQIPDFNEMVSLGDKAISLHILQPQLPGWWGVDLESQNSKCQDLSKFHFTGRGVLESQNPKWKVKTQSVKIYLNFNLGGGGLLWKVKTQSAKICLHFNFCGGGGVFWKVKTQSAKIYLHFNFCVGGVLESQNPKCQDLPTFQFLCGGVLESQNPKCQDLPKFQFWGEGREVFWKVKTQSAKICLAFNFGGKGVFWKVKTQSAKIYLNLP